MRTSLRLFVIFACLLILISCSKNSTDIALTPVNSTTSISSLQSGENQYKLVWSDEFNTDGLPDSTKWGYDVGATGWGNNELEYYSLARSENARVAGGKLIIEARQETVSGKKYYTSARLITKKKAQWTYGKFEIKAMIPKGRGTWPTVWMLPAKEPMQWPNDGELDIMEAVGFNPDVIYGTAHTLWYNGSNGLQKSGTKFISDAQDSFHVYSIEWTDKKVTWFIDNEVYYSYSDPGLGAAAWPFNNDFYLILNIAIGGNFGGKDGVDESIFPQQMVIDYVRVYQIKN